jgi:hypothetical protein
MKLRILEKLESKFTRKLMCDNGYQILNIQKTDKITNNILDSFYDEHILHLNIGCFYKIPKNSEELHLKNYRQNAERMLVNEIYGDIFLHMNEIRMAILNGHKNYALEKLDELFESIYH